MWDRFGANYKQRAMTNPYGQTGQYNTLAGGGAAKKATTKGGVAEENPVLGAGTAPSATSTPTANYTPYADIFPGAPAAPTSTGTVYPSQWTGASDFYNQMMATGMPSSSMAWRQQALPQAQQDIFQGIQQAAEQLGAGSLGKRYGTTMGRTSQDIATKRMNELNTTAAGMQFQADEAARQRQMGAAQGQTGLGQLMNQYGMDLDQMLYGMGTGMQGQQQNQANQLMQYWLGQQPYSNPVIGMAQGLATQQLPFNYPQYTQGAGSQGLDVLSSILPFLLFMK